MQKYIKRYDTYDWKTRQTNERPAPRNPPVRVNGLLRLRCRQTERHHGVRATAHTGRYLDGRGRGVGIRHATRPTRALSDSGGWEGGQIRTRAIRALRYTYQKRWSTIQHVPVFMFVVGQRMCWAWKEYVERSRNVLRIFQNEWNAFFKMKGMC